MSWVSLLLIMYSDDPTLLDDAGRRINVEAQRLYSLVEKALQLSAMDVYEFETQAEAVPLRPLKVRCGPILRT